MVIYRGNSRKILQSCLYQRSLVETGKEQSSACSNDRKHVAKNAILCHNMSLQIASRETPPEFTIFGRLSETLRNIKNMKNAWEQILPS